MGVPYKIYRIYVPLLSWTAHCIGWCGHYGAMSWWARGHPGLCACRKHKKCLKEGRQIWESIATRKLGESPQLPDIAASETYFRSLITTKQDNFYPSRKNKRKRTSVTLKTLLALKVIANLLIQGFLPQCVRKLPKIANVCRPKTTPLEFPQSCSHVVGTLYSKAHHNNFRLWLSIQYKSCLSKLASQHISSRNALLETCPHPPKEKPITDWCVSNIHHVEETSTMSQYIYIYDVRKRPFFFDLFGDGGKLDTGPGPQRSTWWPPTTGFFGEGHELNHLVSPFAQTASLTTCVVSSMIGSTNQTFTKIDPEVSQDLRKFFSKKNGFTIHHDPFGDSPYTNWSNPALQVRPTNAHPPWQALQWLFCWAAKRGVGVRTVWRFFLVKQPCLCKSNNILRLSVCIWLYFYIQIYKDFFTHTKLIHWNVIYHFFQVKKAEVEGKLVTSLRSCIALETFLDSVVTFQQSAFVRDFLASYSLQGIWLDNVIGKNDT